MNSENLNRLLSGFSLLVTTLTLLAAPAFGEVIYRDSFEDLVQMDIQWAKDTTVIEGNAMAALLNADIESGEYQFSSAELANQGLSIEAGEPLLIEGLAVVRVTSVAESGGTLTVQSSEATIADAVENGSISWDVGIGYLELEKATASVGKTSCTPAFGSGSVTFSCAVDDYTMTLMVTSAGDRSELQYSIVQSVGQNATASFTGTGTLDRFNSRGQINYSNGSLDNWGYDSDSLSMQLRIELAAAGSGNSTLDYTLPVPMLKITIPQLAVFGISIDLGAQLIASLTVPAAASASATAQANYSYTGDTGFTYTGGSVETTATINGHDFTDGAFDSAANFANVDAQFGMAFPRLGLSVLNQEVAWLHTGYIIGSSITFGPICKAGYAKLVVEGGYEIKVLGVTLAEAEQTFAERERRVSQNNCAE